MGQAIQTEDHALEREPASDKSNQRTSGLSGKVPRHNAAPASAVTRKEPRPNPLQGKPAWGSDSAHARSARNPRKSGARQEQQSSSSSSATSSVPALTDVTPQLAQPTRDDTSSGSGGSLDLLFHPDILENILTEPQGSAQSAANVLADLSTSPTQDMA